ncbi:hypothetical protein CR513_06763, partial [Mucuna pruriens]
MKPFVAEDVGFLFCWFESGESVVFGLETIKKVKLIQDKMRAGQSRKKSYHDKRRKDLEFKEGDHVFLKVTSWTRVGRALKPLKLSPHLIGSYQILKGVGEIAYQTVLPLILANLHDISMCLNFKIRDNLSYDIQLLRVKDQRLKHLRGKEIILVKIILGGTFKGSVTWELEDQMKISYP